MSIYKIIVEVVEVKYDYLNVMCSNGLSVGRHVTFRWHLPVELENKEICGNLQGDQKVSV